MVTGIQYIGVYVGPEEERDVWVCPQVEKWAAWVWDISKVAKRHPHMAYSVLGISLQLELQ